MLTAFELMTAGGAERLQAALQLLLQLLLHRLKLQLRRQLLTRAASKTPRAAAAAAAAAAGPAAAAAGSASSSSSSSGGGSSGGSSGGGSRACGFLCSACLRVFRLNFPCLTCNEAAELAGRSLLHEQRGSKLQRLRGLRLWAVRSVNRQQTGRRRAARRKLQQSGYLNLGSPSAAGIAAPPSRC
ncbi:hypothetical protein Efla_002297 [Eimeria flavescens]